MLAKRKMNCKDVKNIDLVDFLANIGHFPKKLTDREAWFLSPLRSKENAPSFRVNRTRQLWYDYGIGDGGDIIKLGCKIYNCSIKELLDILQQRNFSFRQPIIIPQENNSIDSIEIISLKPLSHLALIKYLNCRCVDIEIANKYCNEVWYANKGKEFFAIGFKSNSGYELRNSLFKGCTGKGITFINNNSRATTVTEGFFDFLSLLTIFPEKENTNNHIVLNSTANLEKAEQIIKQHEHLLLYLDRDDGGILALQQIGKMGISFSDESNLYDGFNDLNEYLIFLKNKA